MCDQKLCADHSRLESVYGPLAESIRQLIDVSIRTEADPATVAAAKSKIDSAADELSGALQPGSFGVRLAPKPYNHPVRSAESAAVLDLLSDGRVEFGTGRSSTRIEMEGFGLHPNQTREMWHEAVGHIVTCWTEDEAEFSVKHWQLPKRRVLSPVPLRY